MKKRVKRLSGKIGLSPGSAVHVGEKRVEAMAIQLTQYDGEAVDERPLENARDCAGVLAPPRTTWINVDGLHEVDAVQRIGADFGLHNLVIEDILNTHQRAKCEDLDDRLFIALRMYRWDAGGGEMHSEQVSLVLGEGFVLTFQEQPGDVFDGVRHRLRAGKTKIRMRGADYLAYALLDAVVDGYFAVLEGVGESIEELEERILENPTPEVVEDLHDLRRQVILFRKSLWPLREAVANLERTQSGLFQEETRPFLRDLYDHTYQVLDAVETHREMLSGMLDLYASMVGNRMNEIMKVLTLFAAIFIPLTFIAGIYGMNFNPEAGRLNMPELNWAYGYPFVWGLMAVCALLLLLYFKRKRWF